jgi:hypothetical protein
MTHYRTKSDVQESLLHLYLRLNGYFVSSFIDHSSQHGNNTTEIDALAIRHEFNREQRRGIGPAKFLSPRGTDLLFCEVKNANPTFNAALRDNITAVFNVVQWTGLFDFEESETVARELISLFQAGAKEMEEGVVGPRNIRVRPLLCAPSIHSDDNYPQWALFGGDMFTYIGHCLNPAGPRVDCSLRYPFESWGTWLSPLVRYFKERPSNDPGRLDDLYDFLSKRGLLEPAANAPAHP